MFSIPYYMPPWNPGNQIVTLGQGGPASHMQHLAQQPRVYPTVYNVTTMGVGDMPRLVMGPTAAINPNQYSDPLTWNNLVIGGLMKNPVGG